MNEIRVLRIFHSGVVAEFRERERLLRARHGYDVHLVTPPAWPEGGVSVAADAGGDVPVHVVPIHGPRRPNLFWYSAPALRRVVREVRPHLVDIHEEPYSLAAASILRVLPPDVPVCVYTAQNIRKRYPLPFHRLELRALRRIAAAYPCSAEAGERLRWKGYRGPLFVLPLGVSVDGAERVPPNGHRRVGFVGRLVPEKGSEIALRAFALAADGVDATLEIVGAGPDEGRLRKISGELGLDGRVLFRGALSQDAAIERMRELDVLLVPSLATRRWKEQFGRVAAQAMAAGTAVLASDSGSLPEVVDGCGELAREGDVSDFAAKLHALIVDPVRLRAVAAAGRERAERELSWERVADGFDRMYRQVLDG